MKKLLHIIATPRSETSRTLQVAHAFLRGLEEKYPDCIVSSVNLCMRELTRVDGEKLSGIYTLLGGRDLLSDEEEDFKDIAAHIERFLSADGYLITAPMWNFHIPYYLKHYIYIIVQPKYTFKITDKGPEGLVVNRKMVVITSRGWDYSEKSPLRNLDFQEPYLKAIFGFIGIKDIKFIHAQPTDALGPKIERQRVETAMEEAGKL